MSLHFDEAITENICYIISHQTNNSLRYLRSRRTAACCFVVSCDHDGRVETEGAQYENLPFVWAAACLTQHQQTRALGHQSSNGDR